MQEDKNVKKKGFWKRMMVELKKVIWPTFKQTMKSTLVTIAFVLIISIALIVLNLVFGELNKLWINAISDEGTVINNVISGDSALEDGEIDLEELQDDTEIVEELSGEVVADEIISGE